MDERSAIAAFNGYLLRKQEEIGEALIRIPSPVQRLSRGWVFFYQSRAFLEAGDSGKMLVGHGPVVLSDDGRIVEGGSLDSDPETLLLR